MAKKETKPAKTESADNGDNPPNNALKDRRHILTAKRLETIVAVLLGITTLLSAWASWIGHLHGGIQSINFTKSNNASSAGTAEYNLGIQMYLSDYMAWNTLKDYNYELELAKTDGNQKKISLIKEKIKSFKKQSISDILNEGIKWMEKNNKDNPFEMPKMTEKYFETAQGTFNQSKELLEEGKRDNAKGDSYMLVTVIFSLTLFLLGIVGTFKNMPNRIAVLLIAVAFLIFGAVYMCTIPLPTGFEHMNFFNFNK